MSPEAYRYRHLWEQLKQKFFPKPCVFVVVGHYPVSHEHGYDWTIGYCTTQEDAEEVAYRLRMELKAARKILGTFYAADQKAYRAYCDAQFAPDNVDENHNLKDEKKDLADEWHRVREIFRDLIDVVFSSMTDQMIPFPYSHIIGRSKYDGPIEYNIQKVAQCSLI